MQTGEEEDWIVLLEAAGGRRRSTMDTGSFLRLVAACGTPAPTTLFTADRYALQMTVRALDAPSALSAAVGRWRRALRRCKLPAWELVRAEVMTPAELQLELEQADVASSAVAPASGRPRPTDTGDLEEELLRRALFDEITGLPARELFLEEVRSSLAAPRRTPWCQAVIVVYVDLPEAADPDPCPPADELVAEVAHRLRGCVREGDTLARVGPSEFALLARVRSADDSDLLAERILDRVHWPPLGHQPAPPVANVGVAMTSSGGDADELVRMAELAVIAAGRAVGDCHRRFAGAPGTARTTAGVDPFPDLAAGGDHQSP